MCDEAEFDEDNSRLILGPIRMQRWIYSCSKQLLDRVIWAYGQKEGLKFTLFRPFNWIGPKLDSLTSARIGSSRAITQLILNLVEGTPIQLIDGGEQKRCFTDVADGIECLYRIIENRGRLLRRSRSSISAIPTTRPVSGSLAHMLLTKFEAHPFRSMFPPFAGLRESRERLLYYGAGYQDLWSIGVPAFATPQASQWTPTTGLDAPHRADARLLPPRSLCTPTRRQADGEPNEGVDTSAADHSAAYFPGPRIVSVASVS